MIDFEAAMCDPTKYFSHPAEVLQQRDWSEDEKLLLLRQWAYDLRQQLKAEDENMPGAAGEEDTLQEINKLLEEFSRTELFAGSRPSAGRGASGNRHRV